MPESDQPPVTTPLHQPIDSQFSASVLIQSLKPVLSPGAWGIQSGGRFRHCHIPSLGPPALISISTSTSPNPQLLFSFSRRRHSSPSSASKKTAARPQRHCERNTFSSTYTRSHLSTALISLDTMAPPPNPNLPLQERLMALAKTLQCTWYLDMRACAQTLQ